VTHDDVLRAAETIRGRVRRTPLLEGTALAPGLSLKAELLQHTGSFKVRGVTNRLAALGSEERRRGVAGASAGNHAIALAWGAAAEGLECVVFSWSAASRFKLDRARALGAHVDVDAEDPSAAFIRLEEHLAETGRVLVHPFDDPLVMAGQGTVGLEILEDAPKVDVIVVPVGGAGLVAGIAAAVAPRGVRVVGVEPTGEAFNAIVLDEKSNRPFNPMVNAGAIATADLIKGKDYPERVNRLLGMFSRFCGREVYLDNSVFMSERATGHRNRAIGHLMLNFGMVGERIEESLELYFQQCSVLVNCRDLAIMGATLANGGVNPITKVRAIQQPLVKYLLSVMLSCGMYDYAGEWAYRVGIPSKSGVGGGIVGVIPGHFGIGIFSPPLDAKGNSVRGIRVCTELSERFGLHCFESGFGGKKLQELLAPTRG